MGEDFPQPAAASMVPSRQISRYPRELAAFLERPPARLFAKAGNKIISTA
jgi:hypothetical protein